MVQRGATIPFQQRRKKAQKFEIFQTARTKLARNVLARSAETQKISKKKPLLRAGQVSKSKEVESQRASTAPDNHDGGRRYSKKKRSASRDNEAKAKKIDEAQKIRFSPDRQSSKLNKRPAAVEKASLKVQQQRQPTCKLRSGISRIRSHRNLLRIKTFNKQGIELIPASSRQESVKSSSSEENQPGAIFEPARGITFEDPRQGRSKSQNASTSRQDSRTSAIVQVQKNRMKVKPSLRPASSKSSCVFRQV